MYSGAIAATTATHDRGVAMVTSPAPDRSAPMAGRCAAPVRPSEPAMTSTRPKSPLCESAARAGTISRIRSRVSSSRYGPSSSSRSGTGMPMSAITRSPACVSAGGRMSGIFGAPSVTVIDASIAVPSTYGGVGRDAGRQIDRDDRHAEAVDVGDDGFEEAG